MNQFHYAPLSDDRHSIRLFELLPSADFASQIHGQLQATTGDWPKYQALSYVWGDASVTETIKLNGPDFEATRNLIAALRHIRESKSTVTLWIDGICINQKDECSAQIPRMQQIYGDRLVKSSKCPEYRNSFVFWAGLFPWFRSSMYPRHEERSLFPLVGGRGSIFRTGGLSFNDDGIPIPPFEWFQNAEGESRLRAPMNDEDQKEYELRPFRDTVERALKNRLLFTDSIGHAGLVPLGTQKDDVICVLCGYDVPVVLRRVEDDFLFVGQCFLLRLMDGGVVEEFEKRERQKEQLMIR